MPKVLDGNTQKNKKIAKVKRGYYAKSTVKQAGGKYVKSTEQAAVRKRSKTIEVLPVTNDVTKMLVKYSKPGQPTKYRSEFCDLIIRYFEEAEPVVKVVDDPGGKGGTQTKYETLRVPTVRGFAGRIGVHVDTLYEWADKHRQFSEAFARARHLQAAIIEELGLAGRLGKGLAELYFTNYLGYRDSRHIDLTTDGKELPAPITALQLNVNPTTPQGNQLPSGDVAQ